MAHSSGFVVNTIPTNVSIPKTPIKTISKSLIASNKVSYIFKTNNIWEVLIPGNTNATAIIIPVTSNINRCTIPLPCSILKLPAGIKPIATTTTNPTKK